MADTLREDLRQEFWRPPVHDLHTQAALAESDTCPQCGADFVVGSRFCHVCGGDRNPQQAVATPHLDAVVSALKHFAGYFRLARVREMLGLGIASTVAFFFGLACLVGALMVGFIYDAGNLTDWQAIQLWRIEWLLASLCAFVAGILLRNTAKN